MRHFVHRCATPKPLYGLAFSRSPRFGVAFGQNGVALPDFSAVLDQEVTQECAMWRIKFWSNNCVSGRLFRIILFCALPCWQASRCFNPRPRGGDALSPAEGRLIGSVDRPIADRPGRLLNWLDGLIAEPLSLLGQPAAVVPRERGEPGREARQSPVTLYSAGMAHSRRPAQLEVFARLLSLNSTTTECAAAR